jgi:multiple sugar transport system substrate-binding protein
MKRSGKLLAFLLVSTLIAVAALSAEAKKKEVTFWYFHTGHEEEFMVSLADAYNKLNPDVVIKPEQIPQAEYMNGTKLTTAFASNKGPDVFLISPGDFLKYVNSGIAMDLTPYFTKPIRDDFLPSSLDAVTVNGSIRAVPFEIELLGLYYDKDILKAAGIEPPKTWDELVAATKKLTTATRPGLILPADQGYYQNFVWYPFLWQTGANVVDVKNKKGSFEGKGVESALKLWGDLFNAGAAKKLNGQPTDPLVADGTAPMQVVGTWVIANLERDYATKNIGVVPLPIPTDGKNATCAGGWKFMVNSKSANRDAAAKFIMWALAQNVEKPLEWCTQVKFAYSPRKSVIEAGKDIYNKGLRSTFTKDIYPTAIGEPRYPAEVVTIVGDALQSVIFSNTDPKAAAATANDKINKYLKTFKGSM